MSSFLVSEHLRNTTRADPGTDLAKSAPPAEINFKDMASNYWPRKCPPVSMDKEERLKGKILTIPKDQLKEVKGANFVLEQTQDLL